MNVQSMELWKVLDAMLFHPNGIILLLGGLVLSALWSRGAHVSGNTLRSYRILSVLLVVPTVIFLLTAVFGTLLDFLRALSSFAFLGVVLVATGAWFGSFSIGWLVGWPLGILLAQRGSKA
jgi:hypothetical protein